MRIFSFLVEFWDLTTTFKLRKFTLCKFLVWLEGFDNIYSYKERSDGVPPSLEFIEISIL